MSTRHMNEIPGCFVVEYRDHPYPLKHWWYEGKLIGWGWISPHTGHCMWEPVLNYHTLLGPVFSDYSQAIREQLNKEFTFLTALVSESPSSAPATTRGWTWWRSSLRTCRRAVWSSRVALAEWIAPRGSRPSDVDSDW